MDDDGLLMKTSSGADEDVFKGTRRCIRYFEGLFWKYSMESIPLFRAL